MCLTLLVRIFAVDSSPIIHFFDFIRIIGYYYNKKAMTQVFEEY